MIIIETPRLVIREWTDEDIGLITPIYKDEDVMKHVFPYRALSDRRAELTIGDYRKFIEKNQFGVWPLVHKENIEVIGHCGFEFLDDTQEIELRILLGKNYWGQGLGQEAARNVLNLGFKLQNFETVTAVTPAENKRGVRFCNRLNMNFIGETVYYGSLNCCYLMTRQDWLDQTQPT